MLRVNFPRVSNDLSCLPESAVNILIFPEWLPEMMYLSSGENATVQTSAGPVSILFKRSPVNASQTLTLESKELLTITEKESFKSEKHSNAIVNT